MTKAMWLLLALGLALGGSVARGEEVTTFHGCLDAAGRAVPSLLDPALERVVETDQDAGAVVIRYNPERVSELRPATRLFLFAHECARHELGLATGRTRTLIDARRADCAGLATLLRSKLIETGDVAGIEGDPALRADTWALLPGPARRLALGACLDELAARPSLATPVAHQPDWNVCVRSCGETLRACRPGCRTPAACGACQQTYEQCSRMCDSRHPL